MIFAPLLLLGAVQSGSALPHPIAVIPDLHGSLAAAVALLRNANLIDQNGKWSGGHREIVFLGDLLDRGPRIRELLDFVMDLESQAEAAGGKVHTVLGNHEALVATGRIMDSGPDTFQNFPVTVLPENRELFLRRNREIVESLGNLYNVRSAKFLGYLNAFGGDSKYARWMRERPLVLKRGKNVFAHAGITPELSRHSIDEVNELSRQWMAFYQGVGLRPTQGEWIFAEEGPLWTRKGVVTKFAGNENAELGWFLKHVEAARVFVGHAADKEGRVRAMHRGRFFFTDTDAFLAAAGRNKGSLTWVEAYDDRVPAVHRVEMRKEDKALTEKLADHYRSGWTNLSLASCMRGWWSRWVGTQPR